MTSRHALIPAAYLYPRDGDHVLLQLRQGTGYMDGHWAAAAAGHVELGETASACAVREAAEELGIGVRAADLEPLTVMQRTDGTSAPIEQRVDWFFAVRRWTGSPVILEPAKCAEIRWHPLTDLPPNLPPYERLVLEAMGEGGAAPFTDYGF